MPSVPHCSDRYSNNRVFRDLRCLLGRRCYSLGSRRISTEPSAFTIAKLTIPLTVLAEVTRKLEEVGEVDAMVTVKIASQGKVHGALAEFAGER